MVLKIIRSHGNTVETEIKCDTPVPGGGVTRAQSHISISTEIETGYEPYRKAT